MSKLSSLADAPLQFEDEDFGEDYRSLTAIVAEIADDKTYEEWKMHPKIQTLFAARETLVQQYKDFLEGNDYRGHVVQYNNAKEQAKIPIENQTYWKKAYTNCVTHNLTQFLNEYRHTLSVNHVTPDTINKFVPPARTQVFNNQAHKSVESQNDGYFSDDDTITPRKKTPEQSLWNLLTFNFFDRAHR